MWTYKKSKVAATDITAISSKLSLERENAKDTVVWLFPNPESGGEGNNFLSSARRAELDLPRGS